MIRTAAQLRAAIGRAVIAGDQTEADRLRAEYYTLILGDYIRDVLHKSPPLTTDQVERLRALLPLPVEAAEVSS